MPPPKTVSIRFRPGDAVRVLDLGLAGHVRTPAYVRGRTGRIVGFVGCFLNPEALSVGNTSGPMVPLYRVAFEMRALWPEFDRNEADRLYLEVYEHWLAPATASDADPKRRESDHA
jgi:nitrile hydratase